MSLVLPADGGRALRMYFPSTQATEVQVVADVDGYEQRFSWTVTAARATTRSGFLGAAALHYLSADDAAGLDAFTRSFPMEKGETLVWNTRHHLLKRADRWSPIFDTPLRGGMRLLHLACLQGKPAIAAVCLDSQADPNLPAEDGRTPLAIAAAAGHQDIVRLLRAAGAK